MNNPDSGLKNSRTLFHYDSNFKLVGSVQPNLSELDRIQDMVRVKDKWVLLGEEKVMKFDSNWNKLNQINLDMYMPLRSKRLAQKNETLYIVSFQKRRISELEKSVLSNKSKNYSELYMQRVMEINFSEGEVDGGNANPVVVEDIATDRKSYNETFDVVVGSTLNLSRLNISNGSIDGESFLSVDDVQIRNDKIWVMSQEHTGAKIREFNMEMQYLGESQDVGLNETQVKEKSSLSPMALAAILWGLILLVFLVLTGTGLAVVIYALLSSKEE
jgi:hypothetical protein